MAILYVLHVGFGISPFDVDTLELNFVGEVPGSSVSRASGTAHKPETDLNITCVTKGCLVIFVIGMSNTRSEIDRCDNCGGVFKRLSDFDQAVCRCKNPSRPGKKGRPPRAAFSAIDENQIEILEEEKRVREAFKPSGD